MIKTQEVRDFFDRLAPDWDLGNEKDDAKIGGILDLADVGAGACVLDVACGTGVLIPYYLSRGVKTVTGVDLSPEMARLAREKHRDERVRILCADAVTADLPGPFGRIVVFNAFPHFPEPERLVSRLVSLLAPGGRLTVAHDASRETINACHDGSAKSVSVGLMPAGELARIFRNAGLTDVSFVSDEDVYVVTGAVK